MPRKNLSREEFSELCQVVEDLSPWRKLVLCRVMGVRPLVAMATNRYGKEQPVFPEIADQHYLARFMEEVAKTALLVNDVNRQIVSGQLDMAVLAKGLGHEVFENEEGTGLIDVLRQKLEAFKSDLGRLRTQGNTMKTRSKVPADPGQGKKKSKAIATKRNGAASQNEVVAQAGASLKQPTAPKTAAAPKKPASPKKVAPTKAKVEKPAATGATATTPVEASAASPVQAGATEKGTQAA